MKKTVEEAKKLYDSRYYFEHVLLPNLIFEKGGPVLVHLTKDGSQVLYDTMKAICDDAGIDMPYKPEDYSVATGKLEEGFFAMVIGFPQPEEVPLCYRDIIIFDNECKDIGFFTIERGMDQDFMGGHVMNRDGQKMHMNYGDVPKTYEGELNKAILEYCQKDNPDVDLRFS